MLLNGMVSGKAPKKPALASLCCQEKSQVSILRTFERPYGDARADPQLQAFLTYSRVSLMLLDTAASIMLHEDPLVETVGKNWKVLPALVPGYCRTHPKEKIGDVVVRAYNAARVTNGFQPAP